jgi:two-component system sensor histidine kinase AlgZ
MAIARELHDVPSLRAPSARQLLLLPFLASLAAAAGVFIVFGSWRPWVWQSFVVSLLYSTSIMVFAGLVMPPTLRRILPRALPPMVAMTVSLLMAAAAGSLLAGLLSVAVGLNLFGGFWKTYVQMARITAALALVSGFGAFFYARLTHELRETKTRLREKELQEERAQKQAIEARLSSLESRVHPHFLFNTLNSLSALIQVDPDRAERLVERLATLLRSSLTLTGRSAIPLDQEIAIVRDYLSIEHERLGDRLEYGIDIPSDAGHWQVLPFSVQSLVENAVKHGIGSLDAGGRIEIAARCDSTGLRVEVSDNGPGFDVSDVPSGHGLENLVARLETAYGPAASLEIQRRNQRCVVTMHVAVHANEP